MFAIAIKGLQQQIAVTARLGLWYALTCGLGFMLSAQLHAGTPQTPAVFDRPVAFDIPAQPFSAALKAFADQSGVQIFYRSSLLPSGNTHAIRQTLAPRQALEQLLSGTNLSYTLGQRNALVIHLPEAHPYQSIN